MTKTELTKLIIKEIDADIRFYEAYRSWWYSDREDTIYRLTKTGFNFLNDKVNSYPFTFTNWITSAVLLQFGKLNCPYYIKHHTGHSPGLRSDVYVFSDKIAMTIKLYGDLMHYIKTLQ
jgi:hypothetical protein